MCLNEGAWSKAFKHTSTETQLQKAFVSNISLTTLFEYSSIWSSKIRFTFLSMPATKSIAFLYAPCYNLF